MRKFLLLAGLAVGCGISLYCNAIDARELDISADSIFLPILSYDRSAGAVPAATRVASATPASPPSPTTTPTVRLQSSATPTAWPSPSPLAISWATSTPIYEVGVSELVYANCERIEYYDIDFDGVADQIEHTVYNELSQPITTTLDSDADGVWDTLSVREYSTAHEIARHWFDVGSNGSIDFVRRYTFRDGRMVEMSEDIDNDGTTDRKTIYEYDGDRRLIRIAYPSRLELELNYDSSGRMIERITRGGGVGGFVARTKMTWQEGEMIRAQSDYEDDGEIDLDEHYEYVTGRLSKTLDSWDEGVARRITTYSYGTDGALRLVEVGVDGQLEERNTYSYDQSIRLLEHVNRGSSGVQRWHYVLKCPQ